MLDSAYYSLILVFFMTAVIVLAGRRRGIRKNVSSKTGPRPQTRISWLGTYSQGFQRALDVLDAIGSSVVAADPNRGTITARIAPSPLSLAPLGALIRVALTTQDGVTFLQVEAQSGLPGTSGSQKILNRFAEVWERFPDPVRVESA